MSLDSLSASEVSHARRRELGAFYTPDPIASIVVERALDGSVGRVLDPSFGGCSFLRASVAQLVDNGAKTPGELVFGCDVDVDARRYLESVRGLPPSNILLRDFLLANPEDLGGKFDAVVGNPPYIRHQEVSASWRESALSALRAAGRQLPRTASSWAYFVLHAIDFVRPGGAMAMLLPNAVIQADYAEAVRAELKGAFETVRLIRVGERIFDGTHEGTVVALMTGKGGRCRAIDYAAVQAASDLPQALRSRAGVTSFDESRSHVFEPATDRVFRSAMNHPKVCRLSELASVKIGVVTGGNALFVRTKEEAEGWLGKGVQCVPIVSRGDMLGGRLRWMPDDLRAATRAGARTQLLLVEREALRRAFVAGEIRQAERDGVDVRSHCARREPWFRVRDAQRPDAFLRYMADGAPPIVLNRTRCTATNALHRLWWKSSKSPVASIAIGSLTSLYQLSAELYGRSYGGGVLKVEPSAAARLLVPVVAEAGRSLSRIDGLLRAGDRAGVVDEADRVVLRRGLGMSSRSIDRVKEALLEMQQIRSPNA